MKPEVTIRVREIVTAFAVASASIAAGILLASLLLRVHLSPKADDSSPLTVDSVAEFFSTGAESLSKYHIHFVWWNQTESFDLDHDLGEVLEGKFGVETDVDFRSWGTAEWAEHLGRFSGELTGAQIWIWNDEYGSDIAFVYEDSNGDGLGDRELAVSKCMIARQEDRLVLGPTSDVRYSLYYELEVDGRITQIESCLPLAVAKNHEEVIAKLEEQLEEDIARFKAEEAYSVEHSEDQGS